MKYSIICDYALSPDSNISMVDIEDKLAKLKETMDEYRIEYEENTELVEILKLFC